VKVAIFGCGPSGLIAAHACALSGAEFHIYSRPEVKGGPPAKSIMYGSQYLHNPIPDLINENEAVDVRYINIGTPEEYRRKTHGAAWDGIAEPADFETEHKAWNIRVAYERLWCRYGLRCRPIQFDAKRCHCTEGWRGYEDTEHASANYEHLKSHVRLEDYDLVVSTVPRTLWRVPGDEFVYSVGWALGDQPNMFPGSKVASFYMAKHNIADNTIICDGTQRNSWNRASKVFSHCTIEWPDLDDKPHPNAVRFVKPLRYATNKSQPLPPSPPWLFAGRFGEWRKGVLTTDVFDQVLKELEQ